MTCDKGVSEACYVWQHRERERLGIPEPCRVRRWCGNSEAKHSHVISTSAEESKYHGFQACREDCVWHDGAWSSYGCCRSETSRRLNETVQTTWVRNDNALSVPLQSHKVLEYVLERGCKELDSAIMYAGVCMLYYTI